MPRSFQCDGEDDCPFGEDETGCEPHRCEDGEEIDGSNLACDGFEDCSDGSDEGGCVNLDMVRTALEELDYEVDTCSDAQTALARFNEAPERYAAVLLDVTMPGGGGLAAARLMLARRPSVPIVLMSGYTEEDVPPELRRRFIQKPFRLPTLIEAMEGTRV